MQASPTRPLSPVTKTPTSTLLPDLHWPLTATPSPSGKASDLLAFQTLPSIHSAFLALQGQHPEALFPWRLSLTPQDSCCTCSSRLSPKSQVIPDFSQASPLFL